MGKLMDPVEEWGMETMEGAVYGVTLHGEPVQLSPDTVDAQPSHGADQRHVCNVRRLRAATLDELVAELLDPSCQEPNYDHIFLSTYRGFASTSVVVEMLFQRDDLVSEQNPDCKNSVMLPLIQTWLDEYSADFWDPPKYHALRLLSANLFLRPCFRRLAKRADTLLKKFQEESNMHGKALLGTEAETLEQRTGEVSLPLDNAEEQVDFVTFAVRDVAEQLTRLDAELFKKVVPFQCLGCVWSQRDKKENLAPTVRATITQFNTVTNRVITSLLCCPTGVVSPSRQLASSPAQRAQVIEKWISVAQECRQLKNFSSLRAILSALQSNAIYRLKKTWAAVDREYVANFETLCEAFPDDNSMLTSRALVVEDESQLAEDPSSQRQPPKLCLQPTSGGTVPYLGTYLTILTMLDTALPDTVQGGLINFEKRRREFEILSQIRQLQSSCSLSSLPHHPQVVTWLQGCRLLSDQESYDLSQELEPPTDTSPSSPTNWSHHFLTKKLASLLSTGDGSNSKVHADQISVSSSGSSSLETDELSIPQLIPRVKPPNSSQNDTESAPSTSSELSLNPGSQMDISGSSPGPVSPDRSSGNQGSVTTTSSPVYNKQVADSCIVRVSVECGNDGNVYRSIVLTSQDKTAQVIQRALEKHNLEGVNIENFTLTQVLPDDRELCIPEKANVFYAMSPSTSYDFILRRRWRSHLRPPECGSNSGSVTTDYEVK